MLKKYYSIIFDATIHNTNKGNFAIPTDICRLFDIKDQNDVEFLIEDMNGNIRLHEKSTTSGKEVRIGTGSYSNGQKVRITLFNPKYEID